MQLIEHSTLGPFRLEKPDTAGAAFRSWRARRVATGEAMRVTFPSSPSRGEDLSAAEAGAVERALEHVTEVAISGIIAAEPQWADGMFFVATPVPAGRSLADLIKKGRPERLEERLGIAALLANLIATAHENGVAHGQLAPEMIYVLPDGQVAILECGIHPQLADSQERAVRADVVALGRMFFRYFAGEWPETGGEAAQSRNLERFPAALPRSMARKIVGAASGSAAEVPSARNLAIHLALDKAWVKAMAESSPLEVPAMQDEPANEIPVKITESPVREEEVLRKPSRDFAPSGPARRSVAALSASRTSTQVPPGVLARRLAIAGGTSALLIASASLLVLRPRAETPPPPAVVPKLAVPYGTEAAAPARLTYAVRVGPYQEAGSVQKAHQRLRNLGFEPVLIYGPSGIYLRPLTTPEEPKAVKIARGLQQEGLSAIVTEAGPETSMLKAVDAAEPRYRTAGVRYDFEAGQSKGWEISGSLVSMRNSSLFSFHGDHALELALRETNAGSPAVLRAQPESILLPQDRLVARVLQPTSVGGRLNALCYVIDATGKIFRDTPLPLTPEKWTEVQTIVSNHVVLPISEIGLEFQSPDRPWTGSVYVDYVEQQRPR